MSATSRCESCGCDEVEVAKVQRVYLVAADAAEPDAEAALRVDAADRITVLDDIEEWCFVCRSMYPHEPVTIG